jgi:acetamidase/formamidase
LIVVEHELLPSVDTVHWGYLDASLPPVLAIDAGDTVIVHSLSGSAEEAPAETAAVRPELVAIHRALTPSPGPHILTGPIFVRGAMPGDILKMEILDIALRDTWGFNIIRPGKGTLPDDFDQPATVHFDIDPAMGTIAAPWGGVLAARPFFGIMATAPRPADGRCSSIIPGYFGGNLDNKELIAGSTLYLPVSAEGGLVSIGDGHASQGDGEVCLTAVETGLSGRFRISIVRDAGVSFPYAETPSHMIAMGIDQNLEEAVRQALRRAIDIVRRETDLTASEAYTLCSIAADVRISQFVNVKKGAHVMIPKAALSGRHKRD